MGPSIPRPQPQQVRLPGIAGGQTWQPPVPRMQPAAPMMPQHAGFRRPGIAGGGYYQTPAQQQQANLNDPLVRAMMMRRMFRGPGGQDAVSGASIGVPGATPL